VAEAIHLYGAHFWKALALGVPVVALNALVWAELSGSARLLVVPVSAVLMPLSFVAASALATGAALRTRSALAAYVVGVLVFLPFPFLVTAFILPGLAWLALFGLSVPAALSERLGIRAAFARGVRLARADFVHVFGGMATLALILLLTQATMYFVLREYAETAQLAAAALASLVVSPLLFLGSALLYVDQEARLRSRLDRRRPGKERDAYLPDADTADREGSPDTSRQPQSTA
jgi:predicted permease